MHKKKLLILPWPPTAVVGRPSLATKGGDLELSMDLDHDGRRQSACFRFVKQRAFRKRSEIHCTRWHVDEALGAVCEVRNSDWTGELSAATLPAWKHRWVMRHFMIYVGGFGCVEVIAESVSLDLSPSPDEASA